MKKISIITAFFNEQDNLPLFRQRLCAVLDGLDCDSEVVLVDDHSSDDSADVASQWCDEDDRIGYVRLSRNCGSHAAFTAGLAQCTGDCAILLAADLQDPPETIPQLVEQWRDGNHVVWAARSGRESEAWSTTAFAGVYYRVMRTLALPEMPEKGADFLLMDRKVIDSYLAIPEKNTSFLATVIWMGFRQTTIEYVKEARHAGESKWTLRKKVKLFIDSIVSFSSAPIRLMSIAGIVTSMVGLLYAVWIIVNAMIGNPTSGWSSVMVAVLVLGGIQLLTLGVLGEYLWRSFDQSRGRPRYIMEQHIPPGSSGSTGDSGGGKAES